MARLKWAICTSSCNSSGLAQQQIWGRKDQTSAQPNLKLLEKASSRAGTTRKRGFTRSYSPSCSTLPSEHTLSMTSQQIGTKRLTSVYRVTSLSLSGVSHHPRMPLIGMLVEWIGAFVDPLTHRESAMLFVGATLMAIGMDLVFMLVSSYDGRDLSCSR